VSHMHSLVPPNIVDAESSPSAISVRENHNATLICKAEGTPDPRIKWTREDKKPIYIKRRKTDMKMGMVPHKFTGYRSLFWLALAERMEVRGEVLELMRISRTEMGAYLCIASNDVPPAVSKRITLTVECE